MASTPKKHGSVWRIQVNKSGVRESGSFATRQLLLSPLERVLLHIDQHQVHTQPGTNAGTLQTKARAGAGQHGSFVFKVGHHAGLSVHGLQMTAAGRSISRCARPSSM